MTATDELRRLLDERGVEWDELVGHSAVLGTEWSDKRGNPCTALEYADDIPIGLLSVQACLTPEQAIEATLGGDLKAENAKLRELVRELWNCALQYHRFDVYRHEIGVDGCGIGCTANGEGCCACKLEQRMRELGVEV